MENNLIIENLYASYEGALNPGLIERNELRKNDGFCYFLKGSLTYYFKGITLSVKEGDVIFHAQGCEVKAIGIVEKECYIGKRPASHYLKTDIPGMEGLMVKIKYQLLEIFEHKDL